jgi:methionyl-tRNA synthetase
MISPSVAVSFSANPTNRSHMTDARYITTTLPYVNSDPHIGFAFEIVTADALARYWRLMGNEVFFSTGSDEHGQKIFEKAQEEGKDVQTYVDYYADQFKKLKESLNLSYDRFIRTTDPDHVAAAQAFWKKCFDAGDIYKKKYSGLYCVGDEMFLRESDLVNGRCPNHPNVDPIMLEEENYFFALSKYQSYLEGYLSDASVIVPEWRREEALAFVKNGLEDFSISREKVRLSWGIPVPGDESQVMYVWFDALTNYISTLGWPDDIEGNFRKFWLTGKTLQLAGKDQVRFQSIMWQAMLKSAGIPATDQVAYHGFINSGGQKMSKSLGNVINPFELVEKYGTDATRYLLTRHVHPFDDTDITWERLDEWYTADLVNGLGNVVARVMKMAETYLDSRITNPAAREWADEYTRAFDAYEVNKALEYIWSLIQNLDQEITAAQPFKVVKTDPEKGKELIGAAVTELSVIGQFLYPFMPKVAANILDAVLTNKKPENLFPRLAL